MLAPRLPALRVIVAFPKAKPAAFILSRARSTMAHSSATPLLVTPSILKELPASKTVPVDATWFMPNVNRVAYKEYVARRIPRARYLDLDEVASPHPLGLKHMMPDAEAFKEACGKLIISQSTHIGSSDVPHREDGYRAQLSRRIVRLSRHIHLTSAEISPKATIPMASSRHPALSSCSRSANLESHRHQGL